MVLTPLAIARGDRRGECLKDCSVSVLEDGSPAADNRAEALRAEANSQLSNLH